jgi:3-oxoadipate enol-lactonase
VDTVSLPGGEINLRLRGSGPPLVLVSTLAGGWTSQVNELSRQFTVLTYDLRGFGASPSKTGFPTNAEHADDLATVLDALGIPRAVVVGMSHGGLVGQHFAARHRDRLAGLCLVATFAKPHGPTSMLLRMLYGFLERDDLAGFWQVLRSMLFSAAKFAVLERREASLRRAMFDQYDVESLRSIYGQAIDHDSTGWLGAVSCPTLVVGGSEDILFPPVLVQALAELVPGARLVTLPAAHIPPVEVPRLFNQLVSETFGGAG